MTESSSPNPSVVARLFHGTRDVLPEELLPRNELLRTLVGVFESYGFGPLETPAMEFLDILLGKYGEEGEKLIYKLAYKGGEVLALRYDLTVPLSRVVAMNPDLPQPFKRYQIQPVWRADRAQPAQGRFREFIQCDVDTVGSDSMAADAENVAVVHDGIRALGLEDFTIRINNRKLLRGMVAWSGLDAAGEAPLLRAIDKLDKIGIEGVRRELADGDLPRDPTEKVLEAMEISGSPREVLEQARVRFAGDAGAEAGISELTELLDYAEALAVPTERLRVDLHLTRGLDYYTGPIYEVNLLTLERFGSLGGGGRYDDLMAQYGGSGVPATGVSIGLSRVQAALTRLGLLARRKSSSEVLVLRFADTPLVESLRLARELRAAGIPCETCYEAERLKKQFQRAERKGIRFAALLGASELADGTVVLRDLERGEQHSVPRTGIGAAVARLKAGDA